MLRPKEGCGRGSEEAAQLDREARVGVSAPWRMAVVRPPQLRWSRGARGPQMRNPIMAGRSGAHRNGRRHEGLESKHRESAQGQ